LNVHCVKASTPRDEQAPPALLNFGLLVAPGRSWLL